MDSKDIEQLTALLQVHTLALCALFATHPQPHQLREAFETMTNEIPQTSQVLQVLTKAIPDR